jgi:mRNA-degrading endonuclease RelE of RelBE toxin-antitoxin system
MKYEIVYTDFFERELKRLAKKYKSLKSDLSKLFDELEIDPTKGTSIGNNCYKIRLAISSKGSGKSSGGRVITHIHFKNEKVILLSIYDKSEKENISTTDIKNMIRHITK